MDLLTLEELMGLNMNENVQITGWAPEYTRLPLTGETQPRAVIDTRRNLDRDFFAGHYLSRTTAFWTGMRDHLAVTTAGGAGGAHGKKALASGNLPGTAAMSAAFRLGARFASAAFAIAADLAFINFDLGFRSKDRFHEIQRQIISKIRTGHRPAS